MTAQHLWLLAMGAHINQVRILPLIWQGWPTSLICLFWKKRCLVIKFACQKYRKMVKKHLVNFTQMISVSSQRRERISNRPKEGQFKSFPLLCAATLSQENKECSLLVSLIWPRRQMRHTCLNLFLPSALLCHVNLFLTKTASLILVRIKQLNKIFSW